MLTYVHVQIHTVLCVHTCICTVCIIYSISFMYVWGAQGENVLHPLIQYIVNHLLYYVLVLTTVSTHLAPCTAWICTFICIVCILCSLYSVHQQRVVFHCCSFMCLFTVGLLTLFTILCMVVIESLSYCFQQDTSTL